MLEKTGVPTPAQVDEVFPPPARLTQGPVAIIECFQHIPCNPCATCCPREAILPFTDINDRPTIDNNLCNGCTICLTKCPGLAIIVVDEAWSKDRAAIKLPYEFRPLPEKGQMVTALDREGNPVGQAEVIRVAYTNSMNKVPIVSIAVDKSLIKVVRHIAMDRQSDSTVCRCNDLTLEEIRDYIKQGYTSVDEIKRMARLGMGPCQGRSCLPIVLGELSRATGRPAAELCPGTYRPVVKSIKLGALAEYDHEKEGPQ